MKAINNAIDIKLLDCTLRDGGYINDWGWGFEKSQEIIKLLSLANVDIIEVGFLKNTKTYNKDRTICDSIEKLNLLIKSSKSDTMYAAMLMNGDYDISKLSTYSGSGIELLRVTFHDYDIQEGLEVASQIVKKGYKVSINPINIMGYSDKQIVELVEKVSVIKPYQFSIVDTFGSMRKLDLERILNLIDHNLKPEIRLGLHLHENMALSFCLAQIFLDKHIKRSITIDGSLWGMGRKPGNLPIELLADYVNENGAEKYDIDYMLDAIQEYISKYHGKSSWGYMPEFFLSAKYNLHRNYAEYYLEKGDVSHRDINNVLSTIEEEKKSAFDERYAEKLYKAYMETNIEDQDSREALKKVFFGKKIYILLPGKSLVNEYEKIETINNEKNRFVITVNFQTDIIDSDLIFCSNGKRVNRFQIYKEVLVTTSNIKSIKSKYCINYNSLYHSGVQGSNALVMLLHLLKQLDIKEVFLIGADGYKENENNYFDQSYQTHIDRGEKYNADVAKALHFLDMNLHFITSSQYEKFL